MTNFLASGDTGMGAVFFGKKKRERYIAPPRRPVSLSLVEPLMNQFAFRLAPGMMRVHPRLRRRFFVTSMESLMASVLGYEAVPWSFVKPKIRSLYSRLSRPPPQVARKRVRMLPPKARRPVRFRLAAQSESMMPFGLWGPMAPLRLRRMRYRAMARARYPFMSGMDQIPSTRLSPWQIRRLRRARTGKEAIVIPPPGPPPLPTVLPAGPPPPFRPEDIVRPVPLPVPGFIGLTVRVESDPSGRDVREVRYQVATDPKFEGPLVTSGDAPSGAFRLELAPGLYYVFVSAPNHEPTISSADLTGLGSLSGIASEPVTMGSRTGLRVSHGGTMRGFGAHLSADSLASLEQMPTTPEYNLTIRMRELVAQELAPTVPVVREPTLEVAPPLPGLVPGLVPGLLPGFPEPELPPMAIPEFPPTAPAEKEPPPERPPKETITIPIIGEVPKKTAYVAGGAAAIALLAILRR